MTAHPAPLGVLIRQVNRSPVHNADAFQQAIKKASRDGFVLLLIKDRNLSRYVTLKWSK